MKLLNFMIINIKKVLKGIILVCMIVMMAIILLQIIMRYLLNSPLYWSEEFARTLFIWITFLGSGLIYSSGRHISIRIIDHLYTERIEKTINLYKEIMVILLSSIGLYSVIITSLRNYKRVLPATRLSIVFHYFPIGLALFVIILLSINNIFGGREHSQERSEEQ